MIITKIIYKKEEQKDGWKQQIKKFMKRKIKKNKMKMKRLFAHSAKIPII